jgi:hypothetical protein
MSREEEEGASFQRELAKVEITCGLRQALDLRYRQICDSAGADWQRLFGGKDPADACVSVRVSAALSNAIRGAGFLKLRTQLSRKASGKRSPRFAH